MTDFIQVTAVAQTPGAADRVFIIRKSDIKAISCAHNTAGEYVAVDLGDIAMMEVREPLSYFQTALDIRAVPNLH